MGHFDIVQIVSAFLILLAIIDITGSIPIFLNLKEQGKPVKAWEATAVSLGIFIVFFYLGDALLKLFGVEVQTFAVAGAIVLFILAFEMIVGVEIIKCDAKGGSGASIVPIAFPLIAGPGALTTILSLRAEYDVINIMIALLANMAFAYVALRYIDVIARVLGNNLVFIIRKFFGVLLLAIAIEMFASNLAVVIQDFIK